MNCKEIFANAAWLAAGEYADVKARFPDPNGTSRAPILRSRFTLPAVRRATLKIVGLGTFTAYLNGKRVGDACNLPLSTDYEHRENIPPEENMAGHRLIVPVFDVTDLLSEGENLLAVHFGGGWYTFDGDWNPEGFPKESYGDPKVIFRLEAETDAGTVEVISSTADRIGDSFVKTYCFTQDETQDYRGFDDACLSPDFDDSAWAHPIPAPAPDTNYLFSDCPPDRVIRTLAAKIVGERDGKITYDIGENVSGNPILKLRAKEGEKITVTFGEKLFPDGTLDPEFCQFQHFYVTSDGKERLVTPAFSWFAFRYFEIDGAADPVRVDVIHADVPVSSSFSSSDEALNFLYEAYLRTQLDNMHAGIPSDCPHLERRGYTGDGQLCARAAMTTLDAEKFYRKWIYDISDCQDTISGHVQYTAPYRKSGGGPGGWGCAIAEVPYLFWQIYGDIAPARDLYPQMLRYLDYLDAHSVADLVVSDKAGEWCLGDWLPPENVVLPAPFVNSYFYIKTVSRIIEIARAIGRDTDIPPLLSRADRRRAALTAAYFNTWDGNFFGCREAANAFAVDIGIGDERTYPSLVETYRKLGAFDTGIFGTDLLIRTLFEHGDGELALALLMSRDKNSYYGWKARGETTFGEYWPGDERDRSHNHPMFGAPTAYLFEYLLGIRNTPGTVGFTDVTLAPYLSEKLPRISGSRKVSTGTLAVSYEISGTAVTAKITVPEGTRVTFRYGTLEKPLTPGENAFNFTL